MLCVLTRSHLKQATDLGLNILGENAENANAIMEACVWGRSRMRDKAALKAWAAEGLRIGSHVKHDSREGILVVSGITPNGRLTFKGISGAFGPSGITAIIDR
ncbi:MAG: hypothetical protein BWY68_00481 [bacterium ADurb.Bin400]|nr:MAG: hypothetical protein BWY68_00481 [bacterium ADurb.Bin400]